MDRCMVYEITTKPISESEQIDWVWCGVHDYSALFLSLILSLSLCVSLSFYLFLLPPLSLSVCVSLSVSLTFSLSPLLFFCSSVGP